jgi:hypothetical protein
VIDAYTFARRAALFVGINLLAASGYLFITERQYAYSAANSESVLRTMPQEKAVDALIMGSSHGRIFSSMGNHARTEKILSRSVVNISKTKAGLIPEFAYLTHFFSQGNKAQDIIYFLDPPIFYSASWNEDLAFLEDEPLSLRFAWDAVKAGVKRDMLIHYARSKFSSAWLLYRKPSDKTAQIKALSGVDQAAVLKRREFLYRDGLNQETFARYAKVFENMAALSTSQGARLHVIMPATLLGPLPGTKEVEQLVVEMNKRGTLITYVDATNSILDPALYSDHDHLNSAGIEKFNTLVLVPLLASTSPRAAVR